MIKIFEIEKKKLDLNHNKYITTQKFNKITTDNFAAKLKQANLASKNNIGDFVKNIYIDEKLINVNKNITSN